LNLHDLDKGKGRVVVLLHGFCEDLTIWSPVYEYLIKRYRVIAIDLPGFGISKPLNQGFSIDDVAAKVHAHLMHKNVDHYVVIGHSMGGYVALFISEQISEAIVGIGLINSNAFDDSETKKENRNKTISFIKKNGIIPFLETYIPSLFHEANRMSMEEKFKDIRAMSSSVNPETVINYSIAMRDRPDRTYLLPKLSGKILFVCGMQDNFISIRENKVQMEMITDHFHTHILSNCAHMAMYEAPLRLKNALSSFLDDVLSKIIT